MYQIVNGIQAMDHFPIRIGGRFSIQSNSQEFQIMRILVPRGTDIPDYVLLYNARCRIWLLQMKIPGWIYAGAIWHETKPI